MNKIVLFLCAVSATIILALAIGHGKAGTETGPGKEIHPAASHLPASLDGLYPPAADGPVYLFRMIGLGDSFAGIVVDLFENDHDNVKAGFENFRTQYAEVSHLVPEWEGYYPMGPVADLENAISTGDRGKVMAAYQEVGKTCEACHIPYMTKVQHKYHWGNFQEIRIADPLTKEKVTFQQLMQFLDGNFVGIGLDVRQNQVENARGQLQAFRARFGALEGTCMECHDTERYYFVDETVTGMIDKLDQALVASPVDLKAVERLSQGIGMESCHKCHLVHGPAGLSQLQMAR